MERIINGGLDLEQEEKGSTLTTKTEIETENSQEICVGDCVKVIL
jgi:hypothetical protein